MAEDKPTEQPQGGDHIPTETQEEEEEEAPKGLLSKIGDPVGTFPYHHALPPILLPLQLSESVTDGPQATSSAPSSAPSAHPLRKASPAPWAARSAARHDPRLAR